DAAGDGWLRDDAGDSWHGALAAPPHHRADGEGDEGRSREVHCSGGVRLRRQTRRHRPAPGDAAAVVDPVAPRDPMESESPVDILVVDDSADNLTALEAILAPLGQHLVKVRSGKAALRSLLRNAFAVILLDVNMPILDGFETAALIRDRLRSEHTPIIFITAHQDETHVARGYQLGAVDYILTPVVPEVLRAKVGVFVDLWRKT